jgi:hypothetical protein
VINLFFEVYIVSETNQADAQCLRNLKLMSYGMVGLFVCLLALSQFASR